MFDVCLCFTDDSGTYYRHPLVALTSVFANTSEKVSAHILCDSSVGPDARSQFAELADRYGQHVRFYTVPEISAAVAGNVRDIFGIGSLFRLFIPELVQSSRALYLDCDVICNLDIGEIFHMDMGGAVFAGVCDSGINRRDKQVRRLAGMRLEAARYVNSGVLYMDLDKIRSDYPDFTSIVLQYIADNRLQYSDQDALNMFFQYQETSLVLLPEKFNFLVGGADRPFLPGGEYEGKILHFTRDKPWSALYPAALWYWKYFSSCFGPEEAFNRMCGLGQHEYAYLFHFVLRKPKVRRLLNRIFDIDRLGLRKALLKRIFPSRKLKA